MDEDAALAMLDTHCLATTERWKRPRLYVFVESVPRTAAKNTKMAGEMRRLIGDVVVADADGVTTINRLRARVQSAGST